MTQKEVLRSEILQTVAKAISESLAIPPGDIHLESRLVDDLGADSLDFVDIVFMLDRELDIRVRETEFNFLTRLDFSSPQVMKDGFLTGEVVEQLAGWLPAMATVEDRTKLTPRMLFSLVTVEAIGLVAQRKIDERGAASQGA